MGLPADGYRTHPQPDVDSHGVAVGAAVPCHDRAGVAGGCSARTSRSTATAACSRPAPA